MDEVDYYAVDEMAKKLKVSKNLIYHPIHQGQEGKSLQPFIKLGNIVRFKVTYYEKWYKNL